MSALNCKPGDLAVKVRKDEWDELPVGAIVRCVRLRGATQWRVEYQGHEVDPKDGRGWLAADRNLKPLRDPGDDARDETLTWLPVPSTTKEVA